MNDFVSSILTKVSSHPGWKDLEESEKLRAAWMLGYELASEILISRLMEKNKTEAADEVKKVAYESDRIN